MNELISQATKNNWDRLKTINCDDRLTTRANKKLSLKQIIPTEYLSNQDNLKTIQHLLSFVQNKNFKQSDIVFSLIVKYLHQEKIRLSKKAKQVIDEYFKTAQIIDFGDFYIPNDEVDFFGTIYQCLKTEGNKNVQGQYYTPKTIINEMSGDFHLKKNQTYLDPCCGSGAFLLSISCDNPSQIFGTDIDPIAVMIAKFNLIIKYKDFDFVPNVFCMDFLDKNFDASFGYDYDYDYDYILTNPPWGAATIVDKSLFGEISSGESFSYFLVQSLKHLKKGGTLKFLLP
jgi:type I restriction-modification system DNA methylase subunit